MTRHLKAGLSISHPHSSSVKCHILHVKSILTPTSSSKCQEGHEKGSQFKSSVYISRQSLQELVEDLFPSEFSPMYCSCSQNNVRTFQVSGWQRLAKMLSLPCSSPPEVEGQRWQLRRKVHIATPLKEEKRTLPRPWKKSTCHTHGRKAHATPMESRCLSSLSRTVIKHTDKRNLKEKKIWLQLQRETIYHGRKDMVTEAPFGWIHTQEAESKQNWAIKPQGPPNCFTQWDFTS